MKLLTILLFVAIIGLAVAKHPKKPKPRKPPTVCDSENCKWCCDEISKCDSQCAFWHSHEYCRPICQREWCEGERGKTCKDECKLNYCKNDSASAGTDLEGDTADGLNATVVVNTTEVNAKE
ncbi:uncharacterized protein K460DRAFT_407846 [Cucurbitaria berberidis CBS 394.84]|uniref:Uncharacterized protein n=1 Tax=Cucurbitaria berberidis CBS 394.84 TaxID=1168544 RepID=A0A9P4GDH6_9PLEO|nr:uncharacterized protein K460DRAFT_407846 [Cucurbitaria berberidis CBS 394.84]KAF1843494.1 hypothetical protein K460DRAFT_407846 [Cucurbitaria berberidis CBS 394.84]